MDCITSIQLPVFDPEDDHIACRWATGAECGGVCNGLPASKMDTVIFYISLTTWVVFLYGLRILCCLLLYTIELELY